jgi:hypothetical protein
MIVNCHTHIGEHPGRLSGAYISEARARAHGVRLDFRVPPGRHSVATSAATSQREARVFQFGLKYVF